MLINLRLSNWDATSFCPCHTWQFQPSPGRSPEGICWERTDPATGLYIRTWRAEGAGKERTFEHVGPKQCVNCGWDLTISPQANIKSMDPREWQQGAVVNTCLAHTGDAADILPGDVEIEFGGWRSGAGGDGAAGGRRGGGPVAMLCRGGGGVRCVQPLSR